MQTDFLNSKPSISSRSLRPWRQNVITTQVNDPCREKIGAVNETLVHWGRRSCMLHCHHKPAALITASVWLPFMPSIFVPFVFIVCWALFYFSFFVSYQLSLKLAVKTKYKRKRGTCEKADRGNGEWGWKSLPFPFLSKQLCWAKGDTEPCVSGKQQLTSFKHWAVLSKLRRG